MGTVQTLLQIKADARQAVAGLKPLQTSLENTAKDAEATEKALNQLDGSHKIQVQDQAVINARKEIERLRAQMVKDLKVDVLADTRDTERKIKRLQAQTRILDSKRVVVDVDVNSKAAESKLAGLAPLMSRAAAGLSGAVIGKKLFDAALSASDLETNMRAVNTVLGETTAIEIARWSEDNADALNLSQVAASEAARDLSLYAVAAEKAGVPTAEFTENLIRLGTEAAAFRGAAPAEVIESITGALRGEFDTLQRFGINITQAAVDAEGLASGLLKANGEWVAGGREAATYNLILEQSGPLMGSVGRNSDTLGGKLSDLRQKSGDLATTLGKDLAPVLEDLSTVVGGAVGWLDQLLQKRREFVDEANAEDEGGFKGFLDHLKVLTTGSLGDVLQQGKDFASDWKDLFQHGDIHWSEDQAAAAAKIKEEEDAAEAAAADWKATLNETADAAVTAFRTHRRELKATADEIDKLNGKYDDLVDSFSIINQEMVDGRSAVYDYQGAIDDLAQSFVEGGNTFNPDLAQGRDNWDALTAMATAANENVLNTLRTKGGQAANAVYQNSRNTMHKMLTDAGIDSQKAWDLVNQVFQKPIEVEVKLKKVRVADIKADLKRLQGDRDQLTLGMGLEMTPAEEARFERDVLPKLQGIDSTIEMKTENLNKVQGDIDKVANPDEERIAPVKVEAHTAEASRDIDNFIKLRRSHVKIYVDLVPTAVPGGEFFGLGGLSAGPAAAPTAAPTGLRAAGAAMLASPVATPMGAWSGGVGIDAAFGRMLIQGGQASAPGQPVRIAPKQIPIAVYLDGVEIAHRIETRRSMAAVSSVRRSA